MKIFTSDLHFGHKNILKYTRRSELFSSIKEHDEQMIEIWNNNVSDNDEVYHVGDFAFISDYNKLASILGKLNGKKHFIAGNHDNRNHMFDLVHDGLINSYRDYSEVKIQNTKVVLCHYPMLVWNRQHHGSFMLHGHCHGGLKQEYIRGKILDVGFDNYYNTFNRPGFFTEEEVVSILSDRHVYSFDDHEPRQGE